jgi:CHAT domain-containing protein/Flp pilus assembly protein TadD
LAKRIVIALLFLPGFYTLQAQTLTWKELNSQAAELYHQEEYDKAIPVARQAIQVAGKEFGYDHENYITSSNLLANIFFDAGDYEAAELLFLDVLKRKKKLYGEQHASYAGTLLDLGILYSERTGQFGKAESVFTRYTEIIRGLKGERSLDYATALNTLANVYTSLDSLKKAELLYTRARELRKELLGAQHEDYLSTTKNLGYLYSLTEQYPYAISCLDEVIKQANASGNNKGEDHALNVFLLGKALMAEGVYRRADTALSRAAGMYKILYGEESADYAGCINQLGLLYDKTGDFEKAKEMLEKALALSKKIYGDTSSHYATVANNLALLYDNNDSSDQAIRYYNLALRILEKNGEPGTETIIMLLNNLAQVHSSLEKNSEAESYFSRAAALLKDKDHQAAFEIVIKNRAGFYETTRGVQAAEDFLIRELKETKDRTGFHNRKYIFLVKLIASVYMITGRTEEAEINFIRAGEILKEWVGDKDPQYAEALNLLASFYSGLGRFEKSLPLLLEAARIFQTAFGQRNSSYIHCFNQIAMVSLETGQYQLALDLFEEMKELTAGVFGARHKEYAYALARIGHVYYKTKKYEKARFFFGQAGEVFKDISGENTTDYHIILNNLALLYMAGEEYARAVEIFERARKFFQKEIIAEPQNYISATTNLAKAYMEMGKDQEAEQFLRESVEVLEKRQGTVNARSILEKRTLVDLYIRSGQYKKASGVLDSLIHSFIGYIQNSFAVLTEKARNEYLLQHSYLPDLSNSLLYLYPKAPGNFLQKMWGYQLLLKSLSLDDTKAMLVSVQHNADSSLVYLFSQWKTLKSRMAYQYSLPEEKRDPDLYNSTIRLEALERDINHRSTLLGNGRRYSLIPVGELGKSIATDEAVIDFVRFDLYNRTWTDSSSYAAYILRKGDSVPVFVPLFEEKQLQKILDSAGRNATARVNNIYRGLEGKNKAAVSRGAEIYKLVWSPLETHLKGIKRISYSPAGKLYGIAFHALLVDSTTLLMDKYELRQYTSTRQVALRKSESGNSKIESVVLFGDAAFTMDSTVLAKTNGKSQPSSAIYTPRQRGESSGGWSNLPGTAEEVRRIKALFDSGKIVTRSFVQTAASEENLKALSDHSSQVLHIATHGFFLPEPDKRGKEKSLPGENSYTLAEDPLLRSGLILAGGNYSWSGKTPIEGVEDGIATAYEISQLNLSNTELVVLSACETALGDIKGSEGVFGLQRAFKMAGVKKMIVSLWQVPDKETIELMTMFYTYWLNGSSIEKAFSQSQAEMRKKYAPYYWAAFVLVE